MYGYSKFIPLTIEEILKRVSQEEIFGIYIEDEVLLDKQALYKAPYREDNNGDCYFEYFYDTLKFVDFAVSPPTTDCFGMISKMERISYTDAKQFVNLYFKLGLGQSAEELKEEKYIVEVKERVIKEKELKPIIFLPREFDYRDKKFWKQYQIKREQLEEDGVIPVELYRFITRKGEVKTIRPIDIAYAYTDFDDSKVKIYRPNGSKSTKWLTNCNQNDVGNIDNLPWLGDTLIVTKSYKDSRVLRNQGLDCVWFQNEGSMPNTTIIRRLCNRFKRIIVWFDNDSTGLANGKLISDVFNNIESGIASYIFLPPKLLEEGIKDPSDLIAKKGREELLEFLRKHKLYES